MLELAQDYLFQKYQQPRLKKLIISTDTMIFNMHLSIALQQLELLHILTLATILIPSKLLFREVLT